MTELLGDTPLRLRHFDVVDPQGTAWGWVPLVLFAEGLAVAVDEDGLLKPQMGKNTRGPLSGAICWPFDAATDRNMTEWSWAFAAKAVTSEEPGPNNGALPTTVSASDPAKSPFQSFLPAFKIGAAKDSPWILSSPSTDKLGRMPSAGPFGETYAGDFPGSVIAGTSLPTQENCFVPSGHHLVAPHFGPKAKFGTFGWDTDKNGKLDPGRQTFLQTLGRVHKPPAPIGQEKKPQWSLQLGTARGGYACGVFSDDFPDDHGPRPALGEGAQAQIHGMGSHNWSGPFHTGFGRGDKHYYGTNSDGEDYDATHLDCNSYFCRDAGEDAPLKFADTWKPIQKPSGAWYEVFLRYDPADVHGFRLGQRSGLWKWQVQIPIVPIIPDEPGTPWEPPYTPDDPGLTDGPVGGIPQGPGQPGGPNGPGGPSPGPGTGGGSGGGQQPWGPGAKPGPKGGYGPGGGPPGPGPQPWPWPWPKPLGGPPWNPHPHPWIFIPPENNPIDVLPGSNPTPEQPSPSLPGPSAPGPDDNGRTPTYSGTGPRPAPTPGVDPNAPPGPLLYPGGFAPGWSEVRPDPSGRGDNHGPLLPLHPSPAAGIMQALAESGAACALLPVPGERTATTDPSNLYHLMIPNELSVPGLLLRAQSFNSGVRDFRNSSTWTTAHAKVVARTMPVGARLEVFASQQGASWNYTTGPFTRTRYRGGSAPAAVTWLPPEIGGEQILNGNEPSTVSSTAVGFYKTSVAIAKPQVTNKNFTGAYVNGHQFKSDFAGNTFVQALDASAVATESMRFTRIATGGGVSMENASQQIVRKGVSASRGETPVAGEIYAATDTSKLYIAL